MGRGLPSGAFWKVHVLYMYVCARHISEGLELGVLGAGIFRGMEHS